MIDAKLGCDVREIAHHFDGHTGILHMAPGNNCDMEACIEVFKAIDPEVKLIITIAGGQMDTIYKRTADGTWGALMATGEWYHGKPNLVG